MWRLHAKRLPYLLLPAALLFGGWFMFVRDSDALRVPANNLLANVGFEELDDRGVPSGWSVVRENSSPAVSIGAQEGIEGKHSLSVDVSQYGNGNVSLVSPKVDVQTGARYRFAAHYRSTAGFDLVAHLYYDSGAEKRAILKRYAASGNVWTGMEGTIEALPNVRSVAFRMQLSSNLYMEMDAAYVVQDQAAELPSACNPADNLIKNPGLQTISGEWPLGWEPFQYGDNQAVNRLVDEDRNIYATSTITGYKDGQAKWVYLSVAATENTHYCFSLEYKATERADLMARIVMRDNTVEYRYVGTIYPSGNWTTSAVLFVTPSQAMSLQVVPELTKVGSVSTDNYLLSVVK